MARLSELQDIFSGIDDDKRTVIAQLIVQAAEWEMYGTQASSGVQEGDFYQYWSDNPNDRFPDYHFWLRSPDFDNSSRFCRSSWSITNATIDVYASYPVLFGFCI